MSEADVGNMALEIKPYHQYCMVHFSSYNSGMKYRNTAMFHKPRIALTPERQGGPCMFTQEKIVPCMQVSQLIEQVRR